MKAVAISLIFCLGGLIIRSGNTQINLRKFQKKLCMVKIFALFISLIHKEIILLLFKDSLIKMLEYYSSFNNKEEMISVYFYLFTIPSLKPIAF